MTTTQIVRKLNQEMGILRKDMEVVKRMLFVAARDPEGEYKHAFVKKILKRLSSQGPVYSFKNKEEFLHHVRSK